MSNTDAAKPLPPNTSADHLPDDPAILKRMILELLATLHEERHERAALSARLHLLLQRLYGPRSERFDPSQPLLFPDMTQPAEPPAPTAPAAESEPTPKKRAGHGRQRPPKDLPHKEQHHRVPEAELPCPTCGTARQEIGTETTTQLDYEPASLFVVEHIEHKYACLCCGKQGQPQIVAGAKPEQPLGKGSPGAGLLAYLIVSKYADHLPLHRLERILGRQGLELARSTTCDWMAACARRLDPLYDLMKVGILRSRVLHTDDTPVKLQGAAAGETTQARLWVYMGDPHYPYNVFDFTPNRKRDGPQQFLRAFAGHLQADAFAGYDALYLPDVQTGQARICEVACNAHARRKFHDARGTNAAGAHQALAYYGRLYEIERQAKEVPDDIRLQMRCELAVPILAEFHDWLLAQQKDALPKSAFGEAVTYALNQWEALCRYTTASFLAIDNNAAEREMKRIAIGRKNWLFFGSSEGGKTAAILFTFTATCHRLGVEPWAYLKDVLTRLPTTPKENLHDLLPDRWQTARAKLPPAI
jgi:transposase